MTVTDALLGPVLRDDPAGPRITHHDDDAGTRIELSGATVANWAAKTANWLRDELDVQPGDPVAVVLPAHWQTAGVLLGVWWCGAVVTTEVAGAVVAFGTADRVVELHGADEVAVVSLDPLGAGVRGLPPGVHDHATEARVHGDHFTPAPLPGSAPATPAQSVTELVTAASARAAALGLVPGDRVLCTGPWTADGDPLLAVLAARGALVQCTGAVPRDLAARCAQERVTVSWDVAVDGVRSLR